MMFKTHFGETVTVVLAMVMGVIMSVSSIFVDHLEVNFPNFFKVWGMITLVILLASVLIPYKDWSRKFAALFPVREGGTAYRLIDNIIPSLVLNTCNTVIVSACMILYNPEIPAEAQVSAWTAGIVHDWPIMFVISYLGALIAEAVGVKVAEKYCKVS